MKGEKRRRKGRRRGRKEIKQAKIKRYGTTNLEFRTWIFGMDPWLCLVNGYLL